MRDSQRPGSRIGTRNRRTEAKRWGPRPAGQKPGGGRCPGPRGVLEPSARKSRCLAEGVLSRGGDQPESAGRWEGEAQGKQEARRGPKKETTGGCLANGGSEEVGGSQYSRENARGCRGKHSRKLSGTRVPRSRVDRARRERPRWEEEPLWGKREALREGDSSERGCPH